MRPTNLVLAIIMLIATTSSNAALAQPSASKIPAKPTKADFEAVTKELAALKAAHQSHLVELPKLKADLAKANADLSTEKSDNAKLKASLKTVEGERDTARADLATKTALLSSVKVQPDLPRDFTGWVRIETTKDKKGKWIKTERAVKVGEVFESGGQKYCYYALDNNVLYVQKSASPELWDRK